jgi:hypothetical protein
MGSQTIVHGYIELVPEMSEENAKVLKNYQFDESYPFPDIFGKMHPGYGAEILSFGGSLKSVDEDWGEWKKKFESLLSELHAYSARASLYHAEKGDLKDCTYLYMGMAEEERPVAGQRPWKYWELECSSKSKNEGELLI